jgi:glycerol-3-phosphate dehydrogenase
MNTAARADLLIIGGGINGVGIARDAAGRGLKVVLCEQADLASATSSASSKLIHGGLRYLEYYEFRLVRESLTEREILMTIAPHIVSARRFILPHDKSMRPAWMLRAGLFLYDHLGRRKVLEDSVGLDLRRHPAGAPLQPRYRKAFAYSDCQVDDSRLVVLTALDAARHGATILTRTRFVSARRVNRAWEATLEDAWTGARRTVTARILVNVAGPWVDEVLRVRLDVAGGHQLRLVKGSHIVVPRADRGEFAYLLQNEDGRVVFILPYLDKYTLIGTTEENFQGDPAQARIEPDEVAYLCKAANRYLAQPVSPDQVLWTFAGVRPLVDDDAKSASAITRDYIFALDGGTVQAPLLSIYGGKLTTYRRLAEKALDRLAPFLPGLGPPWTHLRPLPGGDLPGHDLEAYRLALQDRYPGLPADLVSRLAGAYGTRAEGLLGQAREPSDLGIPFGAGLYQREVELLLAEEWARTAEDILWRRTKLGLEMSHEGAGVLEDWLATHQAGRNPDSVANSARADAAG